MPVTGGTLLGKRQLNRRPTRHGNGNDGGQGLVRSQAAISSTPLNPWHRAYPLGSSVAAPFQSSVHSRFHRLLKTRAASTAVSAAFRACRVSRNSLKNQNHPT